MMGWYQQNIIENYFWKIMIVLIIKERFIMIARLESRVPTVSVTFVLPGTYELQSW